MKSNYQTTAEARAEIINNKVYELAQELGNSIGFFRYYWKVLPRCASRIDAFRIINLMYYKIFKEEKYASYNSFRRQLNRKRKQL